MEGEAVPGIVVGERQGSANSDGDVKTPASADLPSQSAAAPVAATQSGSNRRGSAASLSSLSALAWSGWGAAASAATQSISTMSTIASTVATTATAATVYALGSVSGYAGEPEGGQRQSQEHSRRQGQGEVGDDYYDLGEEDEGERQHGQRQQDGTGLNGVSGGAGGEGAWMEEDLISFLDE
jgi:hypothetical protein